MASILIPVDGSDASHRAVQHVIALSKELRSAPRIRTTIQFSGWSPWRSVRRATATVTHTTITVQTQPTTLAAPKPMPGTPRSFSLLLFSS